MHIVTFCFKFSNSFLDDFIDLTMSDLSWICGHTFDLLKLKSGGEWKQDG